MQRNRKRNPFIAYCGIQELKKEVFAFQICWDNAISSAKNLSEHKETEKDMALWCVFIL
jgi:hypothetical protein